MHGESPYGAANVFGFFESEYTLHEIVGADALAIQPEYVYLEPNSLEDESNSAGATILTIVQDTSLVAQNASILDAVEGSQPRSLAAKQTNQLVSYEVQDGDTLSVIATNFNIDVATLLSANNIVNANVIAPGTVLNIPPVKGVVHTVRSGDTIAKLASLYDLKEDDIMGFNGIDDPSALQIGDKLILPGAKALAQVSSSRAVSITRGTSFSHLPKIAGYFGVPVVGRISQGIHGLNGVDIAAPCGTPVYAAASGTVSVVKNSGYNGGYGLTILVVHPNGTETRYAHHSRNFVVPGEWVERGEQIASVGSTGRSTGCHLHYEVHNAINNMAR